MSFTRIGMTNPTVDSAEAVQEILDEYDVNPGFRVVYGNEDDKGVLAFDEDAMAMWPSALQTDKKPVWSDDEEEDEKAQDDYFEKLSQLHDQLGQQGMIDLLLALAPHLMSPLVIQVATWHGGTFGAAKEWTVRPEAKEVEVKHIEGMDEEHSIVDAM